MTTKEWLNRGRRLNRRLQALQESKRQAYERAISSTAAAGSDFVGSPSNFSLVDKNASYANLSAAVDMQIKRLEEARAEILHILNQLEDNTLATLLTEYYVNDKTWEEVAVSMGYSWRQVLRLHGQAVQEIRKILGSE